MVDISTVQKIEQSSSYLPRAILILSVYPPSNSCFYLSLSLSRFLFVPSIFLPFAWGLSISAYNRMLSIPIHLSVDLRFGLLRISRCSWQPLKPCCDSVTDPFMFDWIRKEMAGDRCQPPSRKRQLTQGHDSSSTRREGVVSDAMSIDSSTSQEEDRHREQNPPNLVQHEPALPPQAAAAASSSSSTSSSSTTSSSSASDSDSDLSDGSERKHGRVGGLGRGRHGQRHRSAIARVLPVLKDVLREPGAMRRADRINVKEALSRAAANDIVIWGDRDDAVYKTRRNVEAAIMNLYYTDALLEVQAEGQGR